MTASERAARWSDKVETTKYGRQASGLKADRGYVGARAAKMMKSAKVIEKHCDNAIEKKSALLRDIDRVDGIKLIANSDAPSKILQISQLTIAFGDMTVIDGLDFEVNKGDRVAVMGDNGSGKTTMLRAIVGEIAEFGGEIYRNAKLKISYVPQNTEGLSGELGEYCALNSLDKTELITLLIKLGVDRMQLDKPIEKYSDGQKKKLLIARSLCERAELYVWDEPLNYLDIIARRQIEEMLIASNATIIFVEHDKHFCDKVATGELIM